MVKPDAQPMGTAEVMALVRAKSGKGFAGAARSAVDGGFRAVAMERVARLAVPEAVSDGVAHEDEIVAVDAGVEPLVPAVEDLLAEARDAGFAAGKAAGKAAGLAEGRALGAADAASGVVAARDAFVALAARLAVTGLDGAAELSAVLSAAVRQMAAARAGQAIDALPAPFLMRIEALADRVAQGVRVVTVAVNPDDLAAVAPYLAGSDLAGAVFAADARLARGDVLVRAEGIVLADLIGGAL